MKTALTCCMCLRCGNLVEVEERGQVCGPAVALVLALAFPGQPCRLLLVGLN